MTVVPTAMSRELVAVLARDDAHDATQKLLAPVFIGLIVNYFLWGVQVSQTRVFPYHYYRSYWKTDRTWLKASVVILFVVDMVQSICLSQAGWTFLVNGWGNLPQVTTFPGWGFYATPLTDSLTASLVHCFYAHKIWVLLDAPYHYICTGIVLALSCSQLTGGIGGSIFIYSIQMTLPEFTRFKTWASIWLVTAASTDIAITGILSWKLTRSRTGMRNTDDIIARLVRLTVETGLATAIVQIVDIIVFLVWPTQSYHVMPAFIAPKVYSNSMLAILNSRQPTDILNTMEWKSRQERPFDGIRIQTTQVVTGEYELNSKPSTRSVKMGANSDQRRISLDAESTVSLPRDSST